MIKKVSTQAIIPEAKYLTERTAHFADCAVNCTAMCKDDMLKAIAAYNNHEMLP